MPVTVEATRQKLVSFSYSLIGKGPDIDGGNPCMLSGTLTEHEGSAPFILARRGKTEPLISTRATGRFVDNVTLAGTIAAQFGESHKNLEPATNVCTSNPLETEWAAHLCKPAKSKKRVPRGTPACTLVTSGVDPKPGHYENNGTRAKHTYISLDVAKGRKVTTFSYDLYATCAGSKTKLPVEKILFREGRGVPVDEDAMFTYVDIGSVHPLTINGAFLSTTTARGVFVLSDLTADKTGCHTLLQWAVHWKKP